MLAKDIQDEVVTFTQEIVRINSLSGAESDVARVIEGKMRSLAFDRVEVDAYGSVIAWKQGREPGPTVLFDGHIDVVPVTNPEQWTVDPFGGELRDGKVWGRGASDMKGPLAAALVALGRMPAEDFAGTLAISASIGEEKHEGAALELVMSRVQPDFVVICEPNGCTLGIGQKGRAGLYVKTTGKPAHSSVPHLGENAVYKAVEVIQRLRRMALPADPFLGGGVMELIDVVSQPYPSRSTIPVECLVRYDRRLMDGETMDSVLETTRAALAGLPDWAVGFEQIHFDSYPGSPVDAPDFHPGWKMDPDSPWIQKAVQALQRAGIEPRLTAAQFCTNGSYSAGTAKVPTMIFGPSSGLLAHCIDEHIAVEELLQGAAGYWEMARELSR